MPRAVTPYGGLGLWIEFLHKIGFSKQLSEHLPIRLESPNAIEPAQTFTAFLMSVLAGARRFAHASLLRADRALHALLGMKRFPTNDTMRNLFKRFTPGRVVRFYEPLWAWVTARVAHTLIFMYAPLPHARQTARSRSGLFTARDRALREEVNSPLQHQIDPLPLFEFLS